MQQEITIGAIFGKHLKGVSKAGNNYNFIEVSDGFNPVTVNTELDPELDTKHFQKGDTVELDIQLDFFNPRNNKITKIS